MTSQTPERSESLPEAFSGDPRPKTPAVSSFRDHARSRSTVKAYTADWRDFAEWCMDMQLEPLPASPETIVTYLDHRAGELKASTLSRRLVAIGHKHRDAGFTPSPTKHPLVQEELKGIKRTFGTAKDQKAPVTAAELRLMIEALDEDLAGIRDRALILVGFAGAFRRSELVGVDVEHLEEYGDAGYVINIPRRKNDQEGKGSFVVLKYGASEATCPVRALTRWLGAADITSGPAFRGVDRHGTISDTRLHPASVNTILKRTAAAAQLDPDRYGAHSLRAGFVTAAWNAGVSEVRIAEQTGHRSLDVLRDYIRSDKESRFKHSAAGEVGL